MPLCPPKIPTAVGVGPDSCLLGSLLFFWCPEAIGSDNNGLPSTRHKEAKQSPGRGIIIGRLDGRRLGASIASRPNGRTKHQVVGKNKSPLLVASSCRFWGWRMASKMDATLMSHSIDIDAGAQLFGPRRPQRHDGQDGTSESAAGGPCRRQGFGQLHVRPVRGPSGVRHRPRPQW